MKLPFLNENEDITDPLEIFSEEDFIFDDDLDTLVDMNIFDDIPGIPDQFTAADDSEEYFSIADRIMKLDDRLSEEIILRNIESSMRAKINPQVKPFNYISLFRKKILELNPNSVLYNKEYIERVANELKDLVLSLMEEKYSISIGNEGEFYYSSEFLADLEAMYEFFFIRHIENLISYILFTIKRMKKQILVKFGESFREAEEKNDIFLGSLKKKFKNEGDALIIHFISEIIDFLFDNYNSAYDLFMDIATEDRYEVVNAHIIGLLENYGMGLVITNDQDAYEKYISPLKNQTARNEIINSVKMKYLEECVINEEMYEGVNQEEQIDDEEN